MQEGGGLLQGGEGQRLAHIFERFWVTVARERRRVTSLDSSENRSHLSSSRLSSVNGLANESVASSIRWDEISTICAPFEGEASGMTHFTFLPSMLTFLGRHLCIRLVLTSQSWLCILPYEMSASRPLSSQVPRSCAWAPISTPSMRCSHKPRKTRSLSCGRSCSSQRALNRKLCIPCITTRHRPGPTLSFACNLTSLSQVGGCGIGRVLADCWEGLDFGTPVPQEQQETEDGLMALRLYAMCCAAHGLWERVGR